MNLLESTEQTQEPRQEHKVGQSNISQYWPENPINSWVSVLPDGCVVADFPEGTDHLDLKIIIHSDQQPETETVIRAFLPSGEIVVQPQETSGKPEALDFIDQLKKSRKKQSIPDFW